MNTVQADSVTYQLQRMHQFDLHYPLFRPCILFYEGKYIFLFLAFINKKYFVFLHQIEDFMDALFHSVRRCHNQKDYGVYLHIMIRHPFLVPHNFHYFGHIDNNVLHRSDVGHGLNILQASLRILISSESKFCTTFTTLVFDSLCKPLVSYSATALTSGGGTGAL